VTDVLVRERRDDVLVARLNRPETRNALNRALVEAIGQTVLEAEADPDIRVIVLTGTGDRAFCAGMDLQEFARRDQAEDNQPWRDGFRQFVEGSISIPVIGAANATAVAGGLELLLACDLIVASSDARFGLPEVKRGLFPAGGGTFLGTRIPLNLALEMLLTGENIDAARAYEIGLVNIVVAPDQVLDAALAIAGRIAANGPLGVAAAKELARLAVSDHARARERLPELTQSVFRSDDAREGARAFVEKRSPAWKGR
jgi:enoyl-CoA hydratase/carnithine racemase